MFLAQITETPKKLSDLLTDNQIQKLKDHRQYDDFVFTIQNQSSVEIEIAREPLAFGAGGQKISENGVSEIALKIENLYSDNSIWFVTNTGQTNSNVAVETV